MRTKIEIISKFVSGLIQLNALTSNCKLLKVTFFVAFLTAGIASAHEARFPEAGHRFIQAGRLGDVPNEF